jgi:hypothetical protein
MRNLARSPIWLWMTAVTALIAFAACGGRTRSVGRGGARAGSTETPAPGGDGDAPPRRVLHLAIEVEPVEQATPPRSRVDLVTTDQTGATDRTEIGEFAGSCAETSAAHRADAMRPLLSVDCSGGDPEMLLRFVHRGSELIVLRARLFAGEEPSYDEHTRIPLPTGVPVRTD